MKLFRSAGLVLGFLFLVGVLATPPAVADMTVYVMGFRGEFGTLDLSNPNDIIFNLIKDTGLHTAGMGFTSSGSLYLLDINFTAANLYNINPATGNSQKIGNLTDTALGATMGPDGKTMYAIDQNSPAGIYTLSPPLDHDQSHREHGDRLAGSI